jgi:hypothetical protein
MSHRVVVAFACGVSLAASSLLPVASAGSQAFPPPPALSPLSTLVHAAPSPAVGWLPWAC